MPTIQSRMLRTAARQVLDRISGMESTAVKRESGLLPKLVV